MLSMARPASFPRRQLDDEFRAFLNRRRSHVLGLVAIEVGLTALVSVVLLVFWDRGPALWYVLGALHMLLICAVPGAIALAFLANSRTAIWNLRGAMGESNTNEVLQSAKKQKAVWGYIESVAVTGGDIDHLVVTRAGGVLAIDSKWRNEVTADMLTSDAGAARAAARRAESILRSEHVGALKREARARHRDFGASFSVTPVVVIWGAVRHEMPDRVMREGVEFVPGEKLGAWLSARSGQPVDEAVANELLDRLAAFRNR
jgi:hypothetical protein